MVDKVIRRILIEDPKVYSLVQTRVYPAELATIKGVVYPCVNFIETGGAVDDDFPKIETPRVRVWISSKKGYDEAEAVYEAVRDALEKKTYKSDTEYVVFKVLDYPSKMIDPIAEVYTIVVELEIAFFRR